MKQALKSMYMVVKRFNFAHFSYVYMQRKIRKACPRPPRGHVRHFAIPECLNFQGVYSCRDNCDSFQVDLGCVLMQQGNVIAYASR